MLFRLVCKCFASFRRRLKYHILQQRGMEMDASQNGGVPSCLRCGMPPTENSSLFVNACLARCCYICPYTLLSHRLHWHLSNAAQVSPMSFTRPVHSVSPLFSVDDLGAGYESPFS